MGIWTAVPFGAAAFRLCLLRTVKTATHETGHMFSMQHCTAYECNMCGSNSRSESDRRPLALCPQCLAKVCWATGTDPVGRFRRLRDLCRKHGLKDEAAFYDRCIKALTQPTSAPTTRKVGRGRVPGQAVLDSARGGGV